MRQLLRGTKRSGCRPCVSAPKGTVSAELSHSQSGGEIVASGPSIYLVIVGHAGSEAEKAAGSIREYEIAWKPG